jgi:hypothetical protein
VPARFPVPIQEDIRDLLGDLLGRGVAVDKTAPLDLAEDAAGVVASYITGEDEVGALCLCDGPFAVLAGAALVMVPPNVAREQVDAGEIPEEHLEVTHEVANVLSRLLNTPRTPHLRLQALHRMPGDLPADVTSLLARPEFRRDFVTAIEGYGEGRMSILVG